MFRVALSQIDKHDAAAGARAHCYTRYDTTNAHDTNADINGYGCANVQKWLMFKSILNIFNNTHIKTHKCQNHSLIMSYLLGVAMTWRYNVTMRTRRSARTLRDQQTGVASRRGAGRSGITLH